MKALKIVGSILLVLVLVVSTYIGVITKGFRKWKNLKNEKQKVVNFYNNGKTGIPSEDYQALADENEKLTKTVDDLAEDKSKLLSEKTTLTEQVDKLTAENESLNNKYFNPNCEVTFSNSTYSFQYGDIIFNGNSIDIKDLSNKESLSFIRYKKIGFTEELKSDHCTFTFYKHFEVTFNSSHTETVDIIQEYEVFSISSLSSVRNVFYEFGENITNNQKDEILSYIDSDSSDPSYTNIFYYVNYDFDYMRNESGLIDLSLTIRFIEKA